MRPKAATGVVLEPGQRAALKRLLDAVEPRPRLRVGDRIPAGPLADALDFYEAQVRHPAWELWQSSGARSGVPSPPKIGAYRTRSGWLLGPGGTEVLCDQLRQLTR